MKESQRPPIPTQIQIGNMVFGFNEIHERFSVTEYGKTLRDEIRFSYFAKGVSKDKWKQILGVDVNNLEHMPLTYSLTRFFLRYCRREEFSTDKQEVLLLTSIIHDWPEAIFGDIPRPLKTEEDEKKERELLPTMIDEVLLKPISSEILEPILSRAPVDLIGLPNNVQRAIEAAFVKDTKLSEAFNIIENIGYLRTSLRAWQKSNSKGLPENLNYQLKCLANGVIANTIECLISYSDVYPAVGIFLAKMQDVISNAFNNMPNATFNIYAREEREERKIQFESAKKAWYEYLMTKSPNLTTTK